jgi:tetratricopeptide (TPR) repeat protein
MPVHDADVSPTVRSVAGASRPFPRTWFCLLLVLAIWGLYGQVAGHQFLIYDDRTYVAENTIVLQGLSWQNLRWALTAFHDANWFPLTWLSHMLDVQLFGWQPTGHHLVNVAIHAVNAVLLFSILARMTGSPWRSAAVAALFALHPLRVESVAWVAERKDVLSALFWLLTMHAYYRYVRNPAATPYLLLLFCFICGLLSKPMLVTLPFLLLMLDYWPLCRLVPLSLPAMTAGAAMPAVDLRRAVLEKVPLLLLAVASSVVTFIAQHRGGTVSSFEQETQVANLANALISYLVYLHKLVWPVDLAVFYPFVADYPLWQPLLAGCVLIALSGLVLWQVRRRPYLAIGWFWYLGTMVPVIGIVKVGAHAYADRYTYLPLVGVTIMLVWLVAELSRSWRYRTPLLAAGTLVVLLASAVSTYHQLGHWQNSITLFRHTLTVTRNNWLAHNNLAAELIKWGGFAEAEEHLHEAIRIKPDYASPYTNLGILYANRGKPHLAIQAYRQATTLDPQAVAAFYNLGTLLVAQGDLRSAREIHGRLLALDERQAGALQGMIDHAARQ